MNRAYYTPNTQPVYAPTCPPQKYADSYVNSYKTATAILVALTIVFFILMVVFLILASKKKKSGESKSSGKGSMKK